MFARVESETLHEISHYYIWYFKNYRIKSVLLLLSNYTLLSHSVLQKNYLTLLMLHYDYVR